MCWSGRPGRQPVRRQLAEIHHWPRNPAATGCAGGGAADLGSRYGRGRHCAAVAHRSRPERMRRGDYLTGSRRATCPLRPPGGHPWRPAVGGAAYGDPLGRCNWPDDGWGGRRRRGSAMIGWRIERRYEVSRALLYSTPVLAVVLTLAAGIGLFCGLGIDAWAAVYHCFIEPFETLSSIGEVLIKAAPL